MKKTNLLFATLIFFFTSIDFFAQTRDTSLIEKYVDYLANSDSNTQATLFCAKYDYLYVQKYKPFRTGGFHANLGLNFARFFTKKFNLGICLDFKIIPGITKQYFSKEFVNDFNINRITSFDNGLDSLRSDILFKCINNNEGFKVRGNSVYDIGITFSPFPSKYGGFLIKITKTNSYFPFYGIYQTKGLTQDEDAVDLSIKEGYNIELSSKPYTFFTKAKMYKWYEFIILSFYYKNFSMNNSKFNDIPLNKFVDQSFINKYSNQNYFGIKLGLGIY